MSPFTLRRRAARVLLLTRSDHFLLIRGSDPFDPSKGHWWELPGGGIDRSESSEDAALRELYEETGIDDVEIGPCVWIRHTQFGFGGMHFDQHERIHVAWCDEPVEITPVALEALEAAAHDGGRWWELDDLLACDDQTWPSRMRDFLPPLLQGDLPAEPLDVGH